jgi:hypothetical protein
MAKRQPAARQESRSKRDKQQRADHQGQNGHEDEVASYEQDLAKYLRERIKPGLNSSAIPLLARSIAREIAHWEHPNGASEDAGVEGEPSAEAGGEQSSEAETEQGAEPEDEQGAEPEDEQSAEPEDEQSTEPEDEQSTEPEDEQGTEPENQQSDDSEAPLDFEAEMQELQAELGEDWILRFSVQGDDAWLTAEKEDGSQRVEAPTASVLSEAVELINEGGGRST